MKKVLYVASIDQHIRHHHLDFLRIFKSRGYEVHVASHGNESLQYVDKKFNVSFRRNPHNLGNIKAFFELKKIVDSNKYDIIHCHTPIGGVVTRLASKNARKNGSSIIYTAHGFHFYKDGPIKNWLLYYPIERWLSRYTDVLITINKEDYDIAHNFKAKKAEYIPGIGIDTQKVESTNVDRKAKRKEVGINNESIVLLSVGELSSRKNHEVVFKALSKLNDLNICYIICGTGNSKEQYENLIKQLEIEDKVLLLGYRTDVYELIKISDIYVFPSIREGLGIAALEGMAGGLPLISSYINGIKDYTENNKTGHCLSPNDVDGFAHAIKQMVLNKELRLKMGKYNQNIVQGYDQKVVENKLFNIYDSLNI